MIPKLQMNKWRLILANCKNNFGNPNKNTPVLTIIGVSITILFCTVAVISRIFVKNSKGNIEFNKLSLSDDGQIYLFKQLKFDNIPRVKINEIVNNFYPNFNQVSDSYIKISDTRPLYPYISSLFGNPSYLKLLIVPILSFLLISIILFYFMNKKIGTLYSIIIIYLFTNSFYVKYNFITNTTEALAGFFYLLFILTLISNRNYKTFLLGTASAILAIYTRPIDLAIFLPCLFQIILSRRRIDKLFSAIIILITIFHSYIVLSYIEYSPLRSSDLVVSSDNFLLTDILIRLFSGLFVEVVYTVLFDGFLFIIFLLGIYAFIKMPFQYKYTYISILLSSSILNVVSGGIGKGLRYFMPLIFISILFFAESEGKEEDAKPNN
jgi:hypothetical protein